MNNVPRGGCQCASITRMILCAVGLWVAVPVLAETPSPTPPPWQRDLDAARILQTALALAPADNPAAVAERRRRLSELYGGLVSRYPDQPEIQKTAGAYYEQDGQNERALACWQRAATLDPRDATVADSLGSLFLKDGQVREACGEYERAVATRPDVAAYHFGLANVLYLFRKELVAPPRRPDEQAALIEALAHFRRAAELAPGDERLAKAYAETFYVFAEPDWGQALAAWQAVLNLSGNNTDFANGHLARVSQRMGHRADMEAYLSRIHDPAFDTLKARLRRKADPPGK